ncbi:putative PPE family protein PPE29 [Mycobacterium kubicae]|uniref:PPE domain-containing protein n=1 Tax=Mycobacterium kubicae TaxID=120959 RepID=A0AAX1J730_9MYCO|nr:PPE domain-containing protein [Mycobacterium kubicae]MCV7095127.1 PPE domain-containing protein [Mycobacterium kubicae]QNI12781.1 PPE domain-containing protein [Mycobacterium kubicae]QPI36295.1 PPE domain-containing protein [Mycobacterium kubicae]GFG67799.1 putative PPE family protein PPE29 [Mycobacterium kubicae]
MATDFGIYPPEINSVRMYTGPGPGSMLAAAQAWDTLADVLYTAVSGYQSVVSELAEAAWTGQSSAAMSAAADRYVRWLSTTAAQAEQTAAQARTAAAAYEVAFASTVPPPEVAANRTLLAVLVATNFLGQNTPAIAATEALYAEMWEQDALAMYNYAGSSAAAVVLTPFSFPQPNTDPRGTASQAAAISRIASGVPGNVQSSISVVPQALSALAAPTQGEQLSPLASLIAVLINAPADLATLLVLTPADALSGFAEFPPSLFNTLSGVVDDDTISGLDGEEAWPGTGPAAVEPFRATLPHIPVGASPTPTMTAVLGEANTVGRLSVPWSWTVAAPEMRGVSFTTPLAAAPTEAAAPLELEAAMVGQAMSGLPSPGARESAIPLNHARLSGHMEGAPTNDCVEASPAPRTVMTGVAAAIREIARQRAEGLLTEAEYNEHKKHLLES